MRAVDSVQLLASVAFVLFVPFAVSLQRIVSSLEKQGAVGPDRAAHLSPRLPWGRVAHARLVAAGVVRETPDGRSYLDLAQWAGWRRARRVRALTAVAVILGLAAVVFWLSP